MTMKKGEIIGLIVFISFILWAIIARNVNQSNLLQNGKLINARILSWATPGKGGTVYNLFCEFEYNGKQYKLFSPTTYGGNLDSLIGKTFSGMFSSSQDVFEILITPTDFEKYNIPFPDSLEWIRQNENKRGR